ncbi:MAG: ATP phosphoribosyltransferase regulatory subunit, partial [Deltaproteobacteria bacterium]|nr:ATP phosphoribosyltransferase regulatory subunit [Deltaproteobacteria bacterium]
DGDAEVLAVAAAVLTASQLPETRLDVGCVACTRYVLGAAPDRESREQLTAALGRKDRRGLAAASRVLPAEVARLAEALVGLWGHAVPTLARAISLPWPAEVRAALDSLASALAVFSDLADPSAPALTIDLGDVRGFDYYTGIRFAGYAGGAPEAVLRGGRYDELIERYGRTARATGFAVDLEALAQAQRAVGVAGPTSTIGIAVFGPGAASLARTLRGLGIRAVTAASAPTVTWLRGAGFDAAVLLDRNVLVRVADARSLPLDISDPRALVKLIEEDRCPS